MQTPIPPPPPLIPSTSTTQEPTNTYALLLPSQSLFHPPILQILKDFYESFGPIDTWAPVKGLGRVIVVWENEKDGRGAKVGGGDWVEVGGVEVGEGDTTTTAAGTGNQQQPILNEIPTRENIISPTQPQSEGGYFSQKRRKKNSIIIRLHPLPPTPQSLTTAHKRTQSQKQNLVHSEQTQPLSTIHLSAPQHTKNFLISPPGSPPEGWVAIEEDGPNVDTLAEDLMEALKELNLRISANKKGSNKNRWVGDQEQEVGSSGNVEEREQERPSEIVFQSDTGVLVQVEDYSTPNSNSNPVSVPTFSGIGSDSEEIDHDIDYDNDTGMDVEEHLPSGIRFEKATVESMGGSAGGLGGSGSHTPTGAGWRTPGSEGDRTWRITPTGRPPLPGPNTDTDTNSNSGSEAN